MDGGEPGQDEHARGPAGFVGALLDGRYRVARELGSGGMGSAYLAEDTRLDGLRVVVKVPHPGLLQDESFARRFQEEIRSLIRLVHPHVVRVLDVGEHEGVPYAVMQYLGGGTLQSTLAAAAKGVLRADALLPMLEHVAEALDFMHEQGVVHRDIKPENLLLDERNKVYVADFGIAKALGSRGANRLTTTGLSPGTPIYMAPEQAMDHDVSGAADQYALSITAFEALTGLVPFEAETPLALLVLKEKGLPQPLIDRVPDLAPAAAAVFERALARSPAARFRTCAAFVEALGDALRDAPTESESKRTPTRVATEPVGESPKPARSLALRIGAAAVVASAALAFTVWAFSGNEPNPENGDPSVVKMGSLEPDPTSLRNHVETLAAPWRKGRRAWEDRAGAAEYISATFTGLGLVAPPGTESRYQDAGEGDTRTRNVLAWLPGRESGEHVLVGAHYEGMGVIEGVVHPGADNNASGVAALLEIARVLQERRARGEIPRRSLLFVAWDGHRYGSLGSKAYAASPVVPLDECVCALSLDQLGRSMDDLLPGLLFVCGAEHSRLGELLVDTTPPVEGATLTSIGLDLYLGEPDSMSFRGAKVPGLYITCGTGKDWMKPGDTPEKLDYQWMAKHASWIRDLVWRIAESEERPVWRDGRPPRIEEVRAIRTMIERAEPGLNRDNITQTALTMLQTFKNRLDGMIERGVVTPSERKAIANISRLIWFNANLWRQKEEKEDG